MARHSSSLAQFGEMVNVRQLWVVKTKHGCKKQNETRGNKSNDTKAGFISRNQPCFYQSLKHEGIYCLHICERLKLVERVKNRGDARRISHTSQNYERAGTCSVLA
jgi:hypothetical protein